jgi:glycosyltransferase involved in cell wall biosynthesis
MIQKPWVLDIVGSGSEMDALRAYCHSAELDDRVRFHGHVDNVEPFYRAAHLFVFPSVLENSPVVLLEAMSFCLPTLSFYSDNKKYIGANHEIVAHQHTGFLARDHDDFKHILANIIDGEMDISKIGHQAHRYIKEKHGWDRHIDELEKLIQR